MRFAVIDTARPHLIARRVDLSHPRHSSCTNCDRCIRTTQGRNSLVNVEAIFLQRSRYMNWDQVEGNWKQIKGKIKEKFGKLTDDDLRVIAGKREQLA